MAPGNVHSDVSQGVATSSALRIGQRIYNRTTLLLRAVVSITFPKKLCYTQVRLFLSVVLGCVL